MAISIPLSIGLAVAQDGGKLPPTSGRNLNDQILNLPAELPADPTLIVMTFDQDQQGAADRWIEGVQKINANVSWMELAVIDPVNAFVRGMITSGMRRETPDSARRAKFLTVFTPQGPFANRVGCLSLKAVCVAVVERSGMVRGVVSGAYSVKSARPILDRLKP